jgi:hypothetical protein|tara:strand:- start:35 stop:760 length:726 start_codon:yes stop_codon:yes gene_type:complete
MNPNMQKFDLKDILLIAVWYEKQYGYENKTMMEKGESDTTTGTRTKDFFSKQDYFRLLETVKDGSGAIYNGKVLMEKVEDVVAYTKKLPDVPPLDRMYNYYNDLRTVFMYSVDPEQKYKHSQIGLITSAIGLYNQKLTEDDFKEKVKTSKHLGEVGKRGEWFVKLLGYKQMNNDIGGYQYTVITRHGDYGMFYSQNNFHIELGDCFLFSGKVKEHRNWGTNEHIPQTVWNYVKLVENVGSV